MRSIRRHLLFVLMAAAAAIVVLSAVVTYRIARQEVDGIFDYQLRQVALSVGERTSDIPFLPGIDTPDPALDFVVQIWSREGVTLYFSHPHRVLPNWARMGYANVATSEGTWRVFALQLQGRTVQVAQPMSVRQHQALSAALRILIPSLLLLPALAIGIWMAVGRGLRPLEALAAELSRRQPATLGQLTLPAVPAEIAPVVAALNDLLARLDNASSAQRAFVADAAHELRTPLAALRLQAQLVERATDDPSRAKAVGEFTRGLDRMTRVVEQLLVLARQEPGATAAAVTVDLATLARDTIAGHIDVAVAKTIDLGARSLDETARVIGDPAALTALLDNLLDNATRYTPAGGTIDVVAGIIDGRPFLEVSDSGPGIPPEDRPHVFDRFYRGRGTDEPGSGLGLAIVKAIADRHHADVTLSDSRLGGLVVRVTFRSAAPKDGARPGGR
ncbi:MAG TPA: ATP-binding protein [Vineibacter sp.]|nr:ATP-binding protein [Vineibacter sp.]